MQNDYTETINDQTETQKDYKETQNHHKEALNAYRKTQNANKEVATTTDAKQVKRNKKTKGWPERKLYYHKLTNH